MIPSARLMHGDCRELIATLDDESVASIVTDPPYELGFMGKKWDNSGIAYDVQLWTECLRVLKPGGHLLAFGGTRTYHRMASAIEDAGFEIRDSIVWLYGSGFPKSLDVSKSIDKVNGETDRLQKFTSWMRTTGMTARQLDTITGTNMGGHYLTAKSQPAIPTSAIWATIRPHVSQIPQWVDDLVLRIEADREVVAKSKSTTLAVAPGEGRDRPAVVLDITKASTDAAQQWEGWGTALKPAHEPIVVARKPLIGTVAANVQQHGTGALNIDGARVVYQSDADLQTTQQKNPGTDDVVTSGVYGADRPQQSVNAAGRWPANVITDGSIDAEWVRYFYSAKASKAERNAGLDALPNRDVHRFGAGIGEGTDPKAPSIEGNFHPTVKPLALMRYLVRLVTPPGGTVLEPFAGSGTTLAAAILEGFDAIGCELTDDYLPIIEGRIAWAQQERAKANDSLFGDAA
jgi:site-specific DNA-methyltransferase (adenine-specific)